MLGLYQELLLGILLTFIGGALFTNAAEYASGRFRIGSSFIGAVLSPIVTSIPELVVFATAVFIYGGVRGYEIGMGTVMGEPLMIATVVFPILFIAATLGKAMGTRGNLVLEVDREVRVPYIVFTALYPSVLLPAVLNMAAIKCFAATMLMSAYLAYVFVMHRMRGAPVEDYEDLYMTRLVGGLAGEKAIGAVTAVQIAASSIALYFGSRFMVHSIDYASRVFNISPLALSIVVTPIATVLPESITALIWVFKDRDTMAVAALVGEKVLYSTLYPALGIVFTHWPLSIDAVLSVVIVETASLIILYHIFRGRITWDTSIVGIAGYAAYVLLTLS